MLTVGLTGGIACGKSTVADLLRKKHVPVLGLDQVARAVVEPNEPALAEIRVLWPDVVVGGRLDRKLLGSKMVVDPAVKAALEKITHPRISARLEDWLVIQEVRGSPVVVVEDAVMIEYRTHTRYDKLLVVACRPETQRARLMAREGYTAEQVEQWLALQLPLDEKVKLADAVVYNDGDSATLEASTNVAWSTLLAT